jgi:predicted RND superfamily exporter protein
MLKAAIVSTVDFCTKFAYVTIALALLIAGFAVYYTGEHFAINTDITKVFSNDIPWTQREGEFDKLFPNRNGGYILAGSMRRRPNWRRLRGPNWRTSWPPTRACSNQ